MKNNERVSDKGGDNVPYLIVSRASDLAVDLEDDEYLIEHNLLRISPVVNKTGHNKKRKSYDKTKV
jgi:hypothetical protein